MKVLVIGGGISNERDVSLRSAKAVFEAIGDHHEKEFYDWDGGESWLKANLAKYDVVLPILHGEGGEDGQIQTIIERAGVKYLGTDAINSYRCMDKDKTQEILKSANILVPDYKAMDYDEYIVSDLAQKRHVVKPINGGSSLHTYIDVRPNDPRSDQIKKSFDKYKKLLVEEFIDGAEITVPVLEGKRLPIIEIVPPEGEYFDYDNKYNGKTQEICPSINIPSDIQNEAQDLAIKVHRVMGCRHLSRVDMIINGQGRIYTLEINTMPGLTDQSLFPKSADEAGLSLSALVEYFIKISSN